MPSKRYNYKQVQMRFDNIGLCCFGSCLSLLSSTLTHVHTLNTAQALQYKYKYADESKYIQTCLEFAQFSAHSLYLVEMNRAGYPIWFGTFKMCGHRGIANLWIKLENKAAKLEIFHFSFSSILRLSKYTSRSSVHRVTTCLNGAHVICSSSGTDRANGPNLFPIGAVFIPTATPQLSHLGPA